MCVQRTMGSLQPAGVHGLLCPTSGQINSMPKCGCSSQEKGQHKPTSVVSCRLAQRAQNHYNVGCHFGVCISARYKHALYTQTQPGCRSTTRHTRAGQPCCAAPLCPMSGWSLSPLSNSGRKPTQVPTCPPPAMSEAPGTTSVSACCMKHTVTRQRQIPSTGPPPMGMRCHKTCASI